MDHQEPRLIMGKLIGVLAVKMVLKVRGVSKALLFWN